jgi:hypothetical protein
MQKSGLQGRFFFEQSFNSKATPQYLSLSLAPTKNRFIQSDEKQKPRLHQRLQQGRVPENTRPG